MYQVVSWIACAAAKTPAFIDAILEAAGAKPEHVVRMTIYLRDRGEYMASLGEIGGIWRRIWKPSGKKSERVWPVKSTMSWVRR